MNPHKNRLSLRRSCRLRPRQNQNQYSSERPDLTTNSDGVKEFKETSGKQLSTWKSALRM